MPAVRAAAAGEDADGVRAAVRGGLGGGGRGVDAGVDMMAMDRKKIEEVKTFQEVRGVAIGRELILAL